MFNSARLKLTLWYLLIIMFVSVSFSFVIYQMLSVEVTRFARMQRGRIQYLQEHDNVVFFNDSTPPTPANSLEASDIDLINETRQRLILMLAIINAGILIMSGLLGYILADRTLQPIQEMLDEQNRFISDSSHELRTPLTSLKSAMEVSLRDKGMSIKEARVLIEESIVEVNKLQSLSDELLQLAQYEKPNGHSKVEKLQLPVEVKKAIKEVLPQAKKKHISIVDDIEAVEIEHNHYAFNDLLIILLENAIKYSPEDTAISVNAHRTDGTVKLQITDQGIGMDEKDIPHIFERFYRADVARTKSNEGGYGLGLSIAKKIVDTFHGSIAVKSAINQGTTFTITLPIKIN